MSERQKEGQVTGYLPSKNGGMLFGGQTLKIAITGQRDFIGGCYRLENTFLGARKTACEIISYIIQSRHCNISKMIVRRRDEVN
jgi:hypothetical protein